MILAVEKKDDFLLVCHRVFPYRADLATKRDSARHPNDLETSQNLSTEKTNEFRPD